MARPETIFKLRPYRPNPTNEVAQVKQALSEPDKLPATRSYRRPKSHLEYIF